MRVFYSHFFVSKYDVEINVCSPEEQEKRGNNYLKRKCIKSDTNKKKCNKGNDIRVRSKNYE